VNENSLTTANLNILCPFCKKNTLMMLYKAINIPYIGDILLTTIICNTCKFKVSDIWIIHGKGEYKPNQTIKITKNTINHLVCASAGSRISIPALGIEIDIKTFDASHITTIEGILREIIDAVHSLLPTTENREKALEIIKTLEEEINTPSGKLSMTLHDPSGHSIIIPYDLWVARTEKTREIRQETINTIAKEIIKKWKEKI